MSIYNFINSIIKQVNNHDKNIMKSFIIRHESEQLAETDKKLNIILVITIVQALKVLKILRIHEKQQ